MNNRQIPKSNAKYQLFGKKRKEEIVHDPKIKKVSLCGNNENDKKLIVFEWDDTKYQAVFIIPPFGPVEVYDALGIAREMILKDNGIEVS